MLIETKQLKDALIAIKDDLNISIDRTSKNKVKDILIANISMLERILIQLNKWEQKGEINMEALKLGELTTWAPKPRSGSIDEVIIEGAKKLKKNLDALPITVTTVQLTSVQNKVYQLRREGKISDHIVPRKDKEGTPYIVYLEDIPVKRSKK